jgi:precorrin-2 dehydrogenase / sirohydrochlorin ferrochelatase
MRREDLQFLPISINVTNKKILLVGGGKVATHKGVIMARIVTEQVTVVAPEFTDEIKQLPFTFLAKEYEKSDLEGFFLVYVCTGNHELNAQIKQDAEELGILTSVCDSPFLCDFVSPAIHNEGHVTISVGTNGRDAFQSVSIRNQISTLIQDGKIII